MLEGHLSGCFLQLKSQQWGPFHPLPQNYLKQISTSSVPLQAPMSKPSETFPSLTSLSPTLGDTSAQGYSLSFWGKVLGDRQPFLQRDRSNVRLTSETLRMSVRKRPRSSATQRPQLQEEKVRPQREQACPRSPEKEAEEPVLNLDSPAGSLCPAPYNAKGGSLELAPNITRDATRSPEGPAT